MKNKSITINAVLNAVRTLINILFPLITFKYASQILMADNLGKVNFSSSVISYFVLIADFGISTYAAREGAKFRDSKKKFDEFASEIFSLNVITTIFSYILLGLLILFWPKLNIYKGIICIQSISLVFSVIGAVWVNTVYEDYKSILYRSITVQLVSLILLFLFVRQRNDYYKYAFVSVLAQSGANIFNAYYIKKYTKFKIQFSKKIFKHIKSLFVLFGISVTTTIYVNSDITMIGIFGSDRDVAFYSVAVKIYNVIKSLLAAIIIVEIPRLSELYHKKDYIQYKKLAYDSENMLLTLMIPFIAGIIILSKEAVLLVSGKEYLNSVITLRLLCFAILFAVLATYITDVILLPMGYEKGAFLSATISALANIILNLWLIPLYGYNGAAITTIISELLVMVIDIVYVWKKDSHLINLIINKGILNNLCKTVAGVLIFSILDYFVNLYVANTGLRIISIIFISIGSYIISLLVMQQECIKTIFYKFKIKL